jgi:hypothetical protein
MACLHCDNYNASVLTCILAGTFSLIVEHTYMKRVIPYLLCVLVGVFIGWKVGYTLPAATQHRKLLKDYQDVKAQVHMSDDELANVGTKVPQFLQDMKRSDEMAAAMALSAFYPLEKGDIEAAKKWLTRAIGNYYLQYHDKGGDTILVEKIETAAREFPAIADAISGKAE